MVRKVAVGAVLLVAGGAAWFVFGRGPGAAPPEETPVEERGDAVALVRRSPPQVSGGLTAPGFSVFRDAASFAEAWKKANLHIAPVPAPPGVDFGKEVAALAALGEKPTGGFEIRIVAARREGGKLRILYTVREPRAGEFVPQAKTQPWDLVYLPADAGTPEWVKYDPPTEAPAGKGKE